MLLVHKAYKFRIYPDSNQALLIVKTIGCSRFVFNHFLAERNSAYESEKRTLSYSNCSAMLTQLKKELTWLKEVDSTALQSSLRFLDDSSRDSSAGRMTTQGSSQERIRSSPTLPNSPTIILL